MIGYQETESLWTGPCLKIIITSQSRTPCSPYGCLDHHRRTMRDDQENCFEGD